MKTMKTMKTMKMMKTMIGRLTAGLGVAAGALMLAAGARVPTVDRSAPPDGREVFVGKGNCAVCHGEDATGTRMAPDLTDAAWLHGDGSLESIAAVVKSGVPAPKEAPGPMPPRGGAALTDEEVAAVARYVHALSR